MVALAWVVSPDLVWCISEGEGGCILEKGTLNPSEGGWM